MKFAVTQDQMKQIDDYMIRKMKIPGIVLMENAAQAVVNLIEQRYSSGRVAVFCGTGNNGGDGFAVARGLLANGYDVQAYLVGEVFTVGGDARVNYEFFEALGERFTQIRGGGELEQAARFTAGANVIVDALFGTGIAREIEGTQLDVVRLINRAAGYKVSVDIPSGVSGDTGAVMGEAVRANATVTFQYPKIGHYLYPGMEYRGELTIAKIGVDTGCPVLDQLDVRVITQGDCSLTIPARRPNTNKGDYGRLLILAGSTGMAGAAVLCSRAAVRAGAGLTTLASVESVVRVVQASTPEVVCKVLPEQGEGIAAAAARDADKLIRNATALAIGPGLSENPETQEFVYHMVAEHDLPKVFDADALNAIAKQADILSQAKGDVILTPHPKEFSRLFGSSTDVILSDPIAEARAFTEQYDVTLVLKGAVTLVINRRSGVTLVAAGSPGMAKGGSGDVLTGVIGSLCAQGYKAYDAAVLGVLVCGIAGSMASLEAGEYAMAAGDTIGKIGKAMDRLTNGSAPAIKPPKADRTADASVWEHREEGRPPQREAQNKPAAQESPRDYSESESGESVTLGSEGLEEHFNFLSPEDEYTARFSPKNEASPFVDNINSRPAYREPDHGRRIIPKPYKR